MEFTGDQTGMAELDTLFDISDPNTPANNAKRKSTEPMSIGTNRDFPDAASSKVEQAASEKGSSHRIDVRRFNVVIDPSRDALLTEFGKDTLDDRYLLPGEKYQDLFARVASAYADDQEHSQRLYDYISKLWFMPATPVLSNGGTGRGLPISCYLNSVDDSLE
ncbi:ribonucleotide reductase N-terminal alpha domain-containing protein, partial [uncultured Novosphingobium sp.]|uniref:ribonucleotide reductase N-terminal alpha domain-containing protein n=1 Tax=uncultured Novosphingobium sp. TaxID=292277 RepID=UPI002587603B